MSLDQRGKSRYYDFQYRGERYTGCIGAVSKTVAKEILAKKKAEAVEGRMKKYSSWPSVIRNCGCWSLQRSTLDFELQSCAR
jgi:hypothetical protein